MARVILVCRLAVLLAWSMALLPQDASAQAAPDWDASIAEASARFAIPEAWIRRVIEAESGGRTRRNGKPVRSRVGAMGLMQLMPGTWRAMRRAHGLGPDPDDPRDNILAGTAYLRAMYDRFGYPGLFAAYNAGPARYADHLARGTRLPGETVAYLARVTRRAGEAPNAPLAAMAGGKCAHSLWALVSAARPSCAEPAMSVPPRQDLFFELGPGRP